MKYSRPPVPYAFLGDNTAVTMTHFGRKMYIDTRDRGISPHLALNGHWEVAIENVVRKLLRRGDRAIEIGSNMGYHTLAMAEAVGATGRIDAFEANPRMHELLTDTLMLNGFHDRVRAHAKAALDRAGTVQFQFLTRYVGGGNVVAGAGDATNQRISVEAVRLDDFLPDAKNIALIRMDAEGSEPLILRGAERILAASPQIVIVMEFSAEMMGSRANVPDFVRWLTQGLGMSAWTVEPDAKLKPVKPAELPGIGHREIVFSRRKLKI